MPHLPAPPLHADRDRLLGLYAAVGPAANRIYLSVWSWQAERRGTADHRQSDTLLDRARRYLGGTLRLCQRAGFARLMVDENQKLPLWRLIAAILVLAAMAGVLLALAPVYYEDLQLRRYIQSVARDPASATTPDETL